VEAKGLEPSDLLTASQALYQLSYAPVGDLHPTNRRQTGDAGKSSDLRITASAIAASRSAPNSPLILPPCPRGTTCRR
jgi:hypothetical protein